MRNWDCLPAGKKAAYTSHIVSLLHALSVWGFCTWAFTLQLGRGPVDEASKEYGWYNWCLCKLYCAVIIAFTWIVSCFSRKTAQQEAPNVIIASCQKNLSVYGKQPGEQALQYLANNYLAIPDDSPPSNNSFSSQDSHLAETSTAESVRKKYLQECKAKLSGDGYRSLLASIFLKALLPVQELKPQIILLLDAMTESLLRDEDSALSRYNEIMQTKLTAWLASSRPDNNCAAKPAMLELLMRYPGLISPDRLLALNEQLKTNHHKPRDDATEHIACYHDLLKVPLTDYQQSLFANQLDSSATDLKDLVLLCTHPFMNDCSTAQVRQKLQARVLNHPSLLKDVVECELPSSNTDPWHADVQKKIKQFKALVLGLVKIKHKKLAADKLVAYLKDHDVNDWTFITSLFHDDRFKGDDNKEKRKTIIKLVAPSIPAKTISELVTNASVPLTADEIKMLLMPGTHETRAEDVVRCLNNSDKHVPYVFWEALTAFPDVYVMVLSQQSFQEKCSSQAGSCFKEIFAAYFTSSTEMSLLDLSSNEQFCQNLHQYLQSEERDLQGEERDLQGEELEKRWKQLYSCLDKLEDKTQWVKAYLQATKIYDVSNDNSTYLAQLVFEHTEKNAISEADLPKNLLTVLAEVKADLSDNQLTDKLELAYKLTDCIQPTEQISSLQSTQTKLCAWPADLKKRASYKISKECNRDLANYNVEQAANVLLFAENPDVALFVDTLRAPHSVSGFPPELQQRIVSDDKLVGSINSYDNGGSYKKFWPLMHPVQDREQAKNKYLYLTTTIKDGCQQSEQQDKQLLVATTIKDSYQQSEQQDKQLLGWTVGQAANVLLFSEKPDVALFIKSCQRHKVDTDHAILKKILADKKLLDAIESFNEGQPKVEPPGQPKQQANGPPAQPYQQANEEQREEEVVFYKDTIPPGDSSGSASISSWFKNTANKVVKTSERVAGKIRDGVVKAVNSGGNNGSEQPSGQTGSERQSSAASGMSATQTSHGGNNTIFPRPEQASYSSCAGSSIPDCPRQLVGIRRKLAPLMEGSARAEETYISLVYKNPFMLCREFLEVPNQLNFWHWILPLNLRCNQPHRYFDAIKCFLLAQLTKEEGDNSYKMGGDASTKWINWFIQQVNELQTNKGCPSDAMKEYWKIFNTDQQKGFDTESDSDTEFGGCSDGDSDYEYVPH